MDNALTSTLKLIYLIQTIPKPCVKFMRQLEKETFTLLCGGNVNKVKKTLYFISGYQSIKDLMNDGANIVSF